MQRSKNEICILCGKTHNSGINIIEYFQCTVCKKLQQLPHDVCGFGGVDGIECTCGRKADAVWKQISFEEYKKLTSAGSEMTNEEILANAPIGATHVEIFTGIEQAPYYYRREMKTWCHRFIYDWWDGENKQWLNSSHPTGDFRSLSDIRRIVELEKEVERFQTQTREMNQALLQVNERAETAEREWDRLKEYSYEQALLPSASFNGVRELVNDIQKDATDVGGCYEVSTGHLDALFEAFTDSGACKLLNKFAIEQKASEFESTHIPRNAKAGCIGEFEFTIEDGICCPQCWEQQDDDCDLCGGKSNESGHSDLKVTVPWDLCKSIWLAMNKIKAEELRQQLYEAHNEK